MEPKQYEEILDLLEKAQKALLYDNDTLRDKKGGKAVGRLSKAKWGLVDSLNNRDMPPEFNPATKKWGITDLRHTEAE